MLTTKWVRAYLEAGLMWLFMSGQILRLGRLGHLCIGADHRLTTPLSTRLNTSGVVAVGGG